MSQPGDARFAFFNSKRDIPPWAGPPACNDHGMMLCDTQYIMKPMARPRGKQLPNRLCVSFDPQTYADLCTLSRQQGVSASWMVRRAVHELVARHQGGLVPELPLQRSVPSRSSAA